MTDNPKEFLYAWCGRQKLTPVYDTCNITGRMPKFKCEVKVPSFAYVGIGISTNKRDAATNAARDFVNYLIREGKIEPSSLPFNMNESVESSGPARSSMDESGGASASYGTSSGFGPRGGFGSGYRPHGQPNPQDRRHDPGFIGIKETLNQDYIDRVAQKRKFEEAEELDVNSGIHGNWTLDNCKQQLHVFAQANKIRLDYKYSSVGPDHNSIF
uniref:DRBM domain-containing protein n=1 Tax=Tetranychus urticae TaxID=32264 RepID=T1KY05_TETUR